MSRVGKMAIAVPKGVDVAITADSITVKGAKLSADAEDRLFRFFQTGLKNQNHRTLYIPLPGDNDGQ